MDVGFRVKGLGLPYSVIYRPNPIQMIEAAILWDLWAFKKVGYCTDPSI